VQLSAFRKMIGNTAGQFGECMLAPWSAAFTNLSHESGYIGFVGKNGRIYSHIEVESVAYAKGFGAMLSATGAQFRQFMFAVGSLADLAWSWIWWEFHGATLYSG
jgi:hypothetical protein